MTPTGHESTASLFSQFSQEMWESARKAALALESIEQAYDEISTAMVNVSSPNGRKADEIISQALMESILLRDLKSLLAANSKMKEALRSSVEILIKSGEAALGGSRDLWRVSGPDEISLEKAVAQLAVSVDVLKEMQSRLRSVW